jgi:hypothetical protein
MDTRPADVAAIAGVFNADFAHRPVHPGDGRDLVWSPTGSLVHLLALISSTSLNRNRELGLIIANPKVPSAIASTFAAGYRHGKHWS